MGNKIFLKGVFQDFNNTHNGRIYPSDIFTKQLKIHNEEQVFYKKIKDKITSNGAASILNLIDEEEICNYLRYKKIKKIKNKI